MNRMEIGKKLGVLIGAVLMAWSFHGTSLALEGLEGVKAEGFVDAFYSLNFNTPDTRTNSRDFDRNENSVTLNLAELNFTKDAEPLGFRIDLDYGAATSAFGDIGNVKQAYMSWQTPLGVTLEAGKMATHIGYEVIESQSNWNYSRGYLFSYSIPFLHIGGRALVPISDQLYINGYVYNGWDVDVDNNDSKTFGTQVGVTPVENVSFVLNWIGGPESQTSQDVDATTAVNEDIENEDGWRHVLDVIASLDMGMVSLAVSADYGWEEANIDATGSPSWTGVGLFGRVAPNETCAIAGRFEYFDDKDGARLGAGARTIARGATVTLEHKIGESSLLVRLEGRHDWATQKIFDKEQLDAFDGDGTFIGGTEAQTTATLGLVYTF